MSTPGSPGPVSPLSTGSPGPSRLPVQEELIVGANVEVADEYDSSSDRDSLYSPSNYSSETTSVASSIFSYTYANGRRYASDRFKKAEYFMPNDEGEQDRLDLYHHIFLMILGGKLYTAPLDNPQRILDVGTGTGIWAIDMADEHPQAEIRATDISPIQPTWVPPNLKFEVDDMEDEWTYRKNYFDYIHIRTLSGSFKDWDYVLKQGYEHLSPGGFIEFQDYGSELFSHDGVLLSGPDAFPNREPKPGESYVAYLFHLANKASYMNERPVPVARGMPARIEAVGFKDVTTRKELWPLGDWPKDKKLREQGRFGRLGLYDGLYAFAAYLLTKQLGWSVERVEDLVEKAKKDLLKGKYYAEAWFVYGRKPVEGEA